MRKTKNGFIKKSWNLFSRGTKVEDVEALSPEILLKTSKDDLSKILRVVGEKGRRRGERFLWLPGRPGNSWNSEVTKIRRSTTGELYFEIYHQLSGTDTTKDVKFSEFIAPGDYRGVSYENDCYGQSHPRYCVYTPGLKAEVIREIFREFIKKKKLS